MRAILFTLLATAICWGESPIRFPKLPEVKPADPPPGLRTVLKKNQRYVIDSDVELFIRPSVTGVVAIANKTGPITLSGEFVDKPGVEDDDRTFNGKFVYVVKFASRGTVDLIVIPKGVQKDADILTKNLDVQDGTNPQPPPGPGPVPPGPVTSFRVIFTSESGKPLTAAQSGAMFSKSVEEFLNANCTPENGYAGWWRTDKDATGEHLAPSLAKMWADAKPKLTTALNLIVEVNGVTTILPYPKDAADSLATLKQYRGVK